MSLKLINKNNSLVIQYQKWKIRHADAVDIRKIKSGVDEPLYAKKFEILMKRTNS